MASPIAEQCCYPSHCCAQRQMPECLSYSREHNNQLVLFTTERCGHWKISFWASCSGFNTAPPEDLKGRITSKTSSTNRAGGSPGPRASIACFIVSHSFLFLFTCSPQPRPLLYPCRHVGLLLSPRGSGAFHYPWVSIAGGPTLLLA